MDHLVTYKYSIIKRAHKDEYIMVLLPVQFSYWLIGATMFGSEILEAIHIQEGTQRLTLRNCHFGTFR